MNTPARDFATDAEMHRLSRIIVLTALALTGWFFLLSDIQHSPETIQSEFQESRIPNEYGWIQRTFPHFKSAPDAYARAYRDLQALKSGAKIGLGGSWEFAGPGNIGGRVVDVAFDPRNSDVIYAAAATGGVFKSENKGQSWAPIFDDQPVLTIGDLALAPSNPDIIYVGTGEANGSVNNYAGAGMFKSMDAGSSWSPIGLESTASIGRILVHPENPDVVWAGVVGSYYLPDENRGVYKSMDGGSTWDRVLAINDSTGVIDLVMRPDDPDVIFAASWQRVRRPTGSRLFGRGSGIWRSNDGGTTWELLDHTRGLPNPDDHIDSEGRATIGRIGIDISPSSPDTMYAFYSDGTGYLGFYSSFDGGDSWQNADPDRRMTQKANIGQTPHPVLFQFSWFFGQVRVHPTDPDNVFVLDVQVIESNDTQNLWVHNEGTHADHHAMAFDPNDSDVILEGNDGGVAISEDGGNTWSTLAPLPITQIYEISYDPNNPERLYAGTQDNHPIRTKSGFANDWHDLLNGGDGMTVIADPLDQNTAWAMIQLGRLFRIDGLWALPGGSTQPFLFSGSDVGIPTEDPRNWNTPFVIDPWDPNVFYYGTDKIYRTMNRVRFGSPWEAISPDLTKGLGYEKIGTLTRIVPAPSNPDVIYAGTDDGSVWVSPDFGTTWNNITGALPFRAVTRIGIHPDDPSTVYVTFSGLFWRDPEAHIFRSRDMGQSWEDISGSGSGALPDIPINAFAIDPDHPEHLFVGTDIGAFVSLDEGATWVPMQDGMPLVTITDLEVNNLDRLLIAGTFGRGSYTYPIDALVTSNEEGAEIPNSLSISAAYPNPFVHQTNVPFELSISGPVSIAVFDVSGRRVETADLGVLSAGTHEWTWTPTSSASGTYLISVKSGSFTQTRSVVRLR